MKRMKNGISLAINLAIVMLLAVIIGGAARSVFDDIREKLSASPSACVEEMFR